MHLTRYRTCRLVIAGILFANLVLASGFQQVITGQEKKEEPKKQESLKINDNPLAHVKKDGKPNGLINETSPYLLMHAYNPVKWRPWNMETLALAKKEGKPIFLSIGYSSCHWCHVMERESFLDKEIAKFLNENFICIKVDREERPDVDSIYMTSLSIYNRVSRNGGGTGWPLSMFLTSEAKPFFGGTYFPARDGDRGAAVGFLTLVKRVNGIWKTRKEAIEKDAEFLTNRLKKELDGTRKKEGFEYNKKIINRMVSTFEQSYDDAWGGFGFSPTNDKIPKFPQPGNLIAMLEAAERWDNGTAKNILNTTLQKMHYGGLWDHIGFGFHRYSVDRYWKIPHYEKMLYDNGQLASLYARAHAFTRNPEYARVAVGICDFILSEMTSPDGGFYAALDAESEGKEGKYYVWTRDEIIKSLDETSYQHWGSVYKIDKEPNFEEKFYSPQMDKSLEAWAKQERIAFPSFQQHIEVARKKLKTIRDRRERPLTDTKILTSWNGLMIRGMADSGRILKREKYVAAAERAAEFVNSKLRDDRGRLLRTHRKGKSKLNAYLDDYAFFIDGLIALHQATGKKKWLQLAMELQETQNKLFWDEKNHGYFFTSDDHQSLLARAKNPSDGARPSGNSISALNLIYLSKAGKKPEHLKRAQQTIEAFSGLIESFPRSVPLLHVAASKLIKE